MKRKPPRARHKEPSWSAPRQAARRRQPRLRYVPLETVDRCEVDGKRTPSAERIHCACGKVYAGGSVVTDEPFMDRSGECSVIRRCYCDHCNHVMVWSELALPDGTPVGTVLSGPGVYRGRTAVERFLKQHPHAAGVLQT